MPRTPSVPEREVVRPVRIQRVDADPFCEMIARLMDTIFIFPGTNIRFGFDALIGLFPGVGDAVGALISSVLIAQAARSGVPKIIVVRMAGNVLINSLVGAVPILGDVFSVFFRSNVRNYELLKKHAGQHWQSTLGDWTFVISLLVGLLLLLSLVAAGIVIAGNYLLQSTR